MHVRLGAHRTSGLHKTDFHNKIEAVDYVGIGTQKSLKVEIHHQEFAWTVV